MKLSRTSILLLCTAAGTITSISMNTFSLFLPPIENEFAVSRSLATVPYMVAMLGWGCGSAAVRQVGRRSGAAARDHWRYPVNGQRLRRHEVVAKPLAVVADLRLDGGSSDGRVQSSNLVVDRCPNILPRPIAASRWRVVQIAPPLSPLLFAPMIYFLIRSYDWRIAASLVRALLFFIALPLAWFGAHDPEASRSGRSARLGWSAACLICAHVRCGALCRAVFLRRGILSDRPSRRLDHEQGL